MAIYQDTQYTASFQVTSNGAPVDITGWQLEAMFRVNVSDAAPLLTLSTATSEFTVTDPTNGKFSMTISQTQTSLLPVGRVLFDIMRVDTGQPIRLCGGRVKVKEAVTRL